MAEPTIISARGLDFYYGETHALKNINMDIPANQVTALIGPSGCGKSTFLRTINRMNDLIDGVRVTGSLTFHDQEIYGGDQDVTTLRRRIGMVFQKPNPFPMSIYDNVAYGPRTHGIRSRVQLDELVESSLRSAAIWDEVKDRLKKSALGLSGGQQQRLCIARALTAKPEVLLLDEPCSALDVKSTEVIEQLLLRLKESYTIVIVTHNLFQARRIADDCLFLLNGTVWEQGEARELFASPQRRETREYLQGVYA